MLSSNCLAYRCLELSCAHLSLHTDTVPISTMPLSSHLDEQAAKMLMPCRRLLDIEGWGSDIMLLRQQLAATDRKLQQMRLASRLPGWHTPPHVLIMIKQHLYLGHKGFTPTG